LTNVSKEMVLWADLLAKVEAGDPQITARIGWASTGDVKRALIKLATAARAIQTSACGATDSRTPDIAITQNVRFLPQGASRIA
ncbi:MAG: hypothetical protein WBW33_07200, partial [Bryobacteraceae bacterium]